MPSFTIGFVASSNSGIASVAGGHTLSQVLNKSPLTASYYFISGGANINATGSIVGFPDSSTIVLGGTPTPLALLPIGFRVLNDGSVQVAAYGLGKILGLNDGGSMTIAIGATSATQNFPASGIPGGDPVAFMLSATVAAPTTPPIILNELLSDIITFSWSVTKNSAAGAEFDGALVQVSGNYDIVGYAWTLTNSNYDPAVPILIMSSPSNPNHLKLDHITINVVSDDNKKPTVEIVSQNEFLLLFYLTWDGDIPTIGPKISIFGTGDGTQFSGSIMLGPLTVLIVNGSGVYRIVANKTSDTLYTNSAVNSTTTDTKIPDPFIETAYLP